MWRQALSMLVQSGLANFQTKDYGPAGITASHKLPPTKDQIFEWCPQVLQGTAHQSWAPKDPGPSGVNQMSACNDLRENHICLMCSGPLRSGESSTRTRTSQMTCGTRKSAFPSPILVQMWLTGSLLGWLERMATCQQMRWKCWVGSVRTVWFFMALKSTGKVTPMNAKQQNAAKIGTSRHAAQQIYCHIFVLRT